MNKFDTVLSKFLKEDLNNSQADKALSNPTLATALTTAASQGGTQTKQALDALGKSLQNATEPKDKDAGHAVLKDLISDSPNNHIGDALKSSKNKDQALKSLTKMGLQPIPQTNNQSQPTATNPPQQNLVTPNVNQQQATNNKPSY
jgi:hypothetical protein